MSRLIRTLFISHDSGLYGAQRSLLGLLCSIDPQIVQSYVVTPCGGELVQEMEKLRIPVFVRPLTRWIVSTNGIATSRFRHYLPAIAGLRSRVAALRALIERHSIDIVYTNSAACIDGALAARATKRRHVWHLREHIAGNPDLRALLPMGLTTRIVAGLSDHIITNSDALRSVYKHIVLPGRISVVHNGIDLAEFIPARASSCVLRRELGLHDDTKLVTIIASITPRKGHFLFAKAAAQVRQAYEKVIFLVIGSGEKMYVDTVKRHVRERGLDECFRFMGWRSDVADILRASDVLVVASDEEAFGRTVIEAMATGVPVVATRSGGPEEIVVDGETGLLVPTKDPNAMAHAIASIIADAAFAARLGKAGRERAEKAFSVQTYARAIQSILTQVARSAVDHA